MVIEVTRGSTFVGELGERKGWQTVITLGSRSGWLLGLTVAIWGIWPVSGVRAQEGARVSTSPRPIPSLKEDVLPKANIRSDVNLVLIPVTVTDPMNRFVTGLEKEHFKIYEDKKEQQIAQFSSDDVPLSVGLLFDCSGSMGPKLRSSREAVAQFFKTANPEDEAFLVEIATPPSWR